MPHQENHLVRSHRVNSNHTVCMDFFFSGTADVARGLVLTEVEAVRAKTVYTLWSCTSSNRQKANHQKTHTNLLLRHNPLLTIRMLSYRTLVKSLRTSECTRYNTTCSAVSRVTQSSNQQKVPAVVTHAGKSEMTNSNKASRQR